MFFVAAMLLLVMVLTYAILREQHPPMKNPPLHSSGKRSEQAVLTKEL